MGGNRSSFNWNLRNEFKLNNFDLLRLVAASQVMLTHTALRLSVGESSWWTLIRAFPGVPIFFVISGFLISASYERSANIRNFALNRLLRIYPGLWCCVLVTIPVAILFGMNFMNRQTPIWVFSQLIGVIYTPQFLKDFGMGSYNGSLWTIPIELQFYLLLPVLYWLIYKTKNQKLYFGLTWFTFLSIAFVYHLLFPSLDILQIEPKIQKLFRYSFFPHFYLFLTGVLLQRLGAYKLKCVADKGLYWLVGYLIFFYLLPSSTSTTLVRMLILAITVVSVAYTKPNISHKLIKGKDISYGVYIYHGLIINIFICMGLTGHAEYLIVLSCITYLVGYLSWVGIERPFLHKKKETINPELMTQLGATGSNYGK